MPYPQGALTISLLIVLISGSVGAGVWLKQRKTTERLLRLKNRDVLDVDFLVDQLAEKSDVDRGTAKKEWIALADALALPAGLLRPEDVVEELIGQDYFVGDAVLEIERKLQSLPGQELHKPTVGQVVLSLSVNYLVAETNDAVEEIFHN